MSLIQCPECKKKISDTTDSCPNCGYKLTPEKIAEIKKKAKMTLKVCGIGCLSIIIVIFFLIIAVNINDTKKDVPKTKEELRKEKIEKQEEVRIEREKAKEADVKTYRERANSDDAESRTEAFFHGEARALVILHVEPNKLRVGGQEFRVKRNPVGKGCFVYDPRTQFYGVKRNLVWWAPKEDKAYPLNSPSKTVTPGLKWPREEGVDAPSTFKVIDYVFEGKPMMTAIAPSASPSVPLLAEEFKGVQYTIIDSSRLLNIKCSLDIRLQQKVSKEFLKRLALKLRADEPRSYERMFIVYYLPGMITGAGAWATTHFDPNLKVEIYGMTIEEEKKLKTKSKAPVSDIIGEWLGETPFISGKTTILKKNGKIFMIREFKDGSSLEKEMIQKQKSGKLRFEEKSGNDFGEYYLIDSRGRLAVYDNDGLINTIQPIKDSLSFSLP